MKSFILRVFIAFVIVGFNVNENQVLGQSTVFSPNDPIVAYNPALPPTQPVSGPGKWVRTSRMSWNTSSFKCYIYRGIAFRLKYPKTYVPGNGKKYPLFLFYHGVGERGSIYDNEYQLYHGGQLHSQAVDNGVFDGYLLYPQCTNTVFTAAELAIILELIENYLIPEIQVDPFRIIVDGLSGGGLATWRSFFANPKLFAAVLPISNADNSYGTQVSANKFTKIWLFQGALDKNPDPSDARGVRNAAVAAGANFTYTEYPTRGHDCWYQAWGEPNYFNYIVTAHKANPWPVNGKYEFCAEETSTMSQVIGVSSGFDGYEWRKNDTLINGATSNTITATALGVYTCRILHGSDWSPWSPIPVQLKLKTSNVSPTPELGEYASKVLPAPDGNTTVQLKVAEGFASYKWMKVGNTTTLSTINTYSAGPGNYQVITTTSAACPSTPSEAFTVIDANGPNKPAAVRGLMVSKLSQTSLKLNWIINPGAPYPATNFEIYQATSSGGPYKFVGITDANTRSFTKVELTPGVKYYYVVRAVNNTAGSDISSEVSETTSVDVTPPTAPSSLTIVGTTRTSIAVEWGESTDDAGIAAYDIYLNGVKTYSTTTTSYIVNNLSYNNLYTISVKARDIADNASPFSNQVSARTVAGGLTYKYYTGEWTNLPDFNNTKIQTAGFVPNVNLNNRLQDENFGFLWEGYIRIPVDGSYTFRTYSDDGCKIYFNTQYSFGATALVSDDGTHAAQYKETTISLTAGVYPIAVAYFQATGGRTIELSWKNPQSSGNYVSIPDSVFVEASVAATNIPTAPSGLNASATSYKKVSLTWVDNSSNETAFELFRSTDAMNDYKTVAVLPANTTGFQDTTVAAATKYFYKIRAINQNGESAYDKFGSGVNYAYYETSAFSSMPSYNTLNALSPVKKGRVTNFSLGMQARNDYFAVKFDSYINIASAGDYKFYTKADDGSQLYIDGNLVVVDNNAPHSASTDKSGTVNNLSAGIHTIAVTYFENAGSESLVVNYEKTNSPVIAKQIIPFSILGVEYTNVTTPSAPPAPSAPSDLHATNITSSSIKITWTNNDSTVNKYEVYRSFENNQNYVLYATVTNNFYADTVLFPNSNAYYKVKALSSSGSSDFSGELSVVTLGVLPVIDPVENQYMRYGTQLIVPIKATSPISETVTLSANGLPSFATFASTGSGTGTITFNNPSAAQQGAYNNIQIVATNPQNNAVTRSFNLTVNSNYLPVVTGVTSISLQEGQTQQTTFTATDNDAADAILWSFSGLPNFVTVAANNKTCQLTLSPLVGSAGSYNVIATANDGKNGKDTMAFVINVSAINQVYIHFGPSSSYIAPSPWNSIGKVLAANETYPATTNPGFKNKNGVTTNIRIKPDNLAYANEAGQVTGSNIGIYPDIVLKAGYKIQKDNPTNFRILGLDVTKKYSFTFFASFIVSGDFSSKYTIGSKSVVLNPYLNTQSVVKITEVQPEPDGSVLINVARSATNANSFSYINSIIVSEGNIDAQTVPARITNFAVKFENNAAKLTWTNNASNADANDIYRATSLVGPYTLLNPGANNGTAQSYNDSAVQGNKTYYYFVRTRNSVGVSNSSTLKILIPNRKPIIVTKEAFCKTEQTSNISVSASDDPGEALVLTASDLPSFITFTDNGNGSGNLQVTPLPGNKGVFNVSITATDNFGASTTGVVKIYITDKNVSSIYVNFNKTIPVAGIWNSFNQVPTQGLKISNLKNDVNAATTVAVTLVDAWSGSGDVGVITGDNSGVYRDDVMQTYYSESGTSARRIKISGLSTDPNVRYNLVFFSSVSAINERIAVYTVGSKSVSLNGQNNINKTVQINDIAATNGEIEYNVVKASTSSVAYINALVIQSYTTSTTLLSPDNVMAMPVGKDSIKLVWNNRVDDGTIEIYRSTTASGTYSLVNTVSGNTYTDIGLQSNTEYFYKLKAIKSPNVSNYSNTVSASTYAYSVYINFNRDNPAAQPWNNTNRDPMAEDSYPYFVTDANVPSGITMTVGSGFSSTNASGENTGSNSGVVPDNVMRSTWWADIGQTGHLVFSGLSQKMSYSLKFFASRTASDTRYTRYIINGKFVRLKVNNNRTETVTMDNIYPDENGVIELAIQGDDTNNMFGYIGGLIISAYKQPSNPIDGTGGAAFRESKGDSVAHTSVSNSAEQISKNKLEVYPNPFVNDVVLKLSLANDVSKLSVKVTDISGRVVLVRNYNNIYKGIWRETSLFNNTNLNAGVYFINVQGITGDIIPPLRIVKMKQ
ncbi:MAG: fibronectin type III domain-containing protein [Chitinophagaceae bacterium]|nr:fibronectin type III domain-containing protein [Chitinophagaceae bacterium]